MFPEETEFLIADTDSRFSRSGILLQPESNLLVHFVVMCVGGVFSEFLVDSCVCKVITEGAINVGGSIDDGWAYFFVAIDDEDVSSGSEVVNCLELAWK